GRVAGNRLHGPRRASRLLGVPRQLPRRCRLRASGGDAIRAAAAPRQPSRRDRRMDAESALDADRPRDPRGFRVAEAVPGVARTQACGRRISVAEGEGKYCRGAVSGPRRSQARADASRRLSQETGGAAAASGLHGEQMMETTMLSPDRFSDLAPLSTAAADY